MAGATGSPYLWWPDLPAPPAWGVLHYWAQTLPASQRGRWFGSVRTQLRRGKWTSLRASIGHVGNR